MNLDITQTFTFPNNQVINVFELDVVNVDGKDAARIYLRDVAANKHIFAYNKTFVGGTTKITDSVDYYETSNEKAQDALEIMKKHGIIYLDNWEVLINPFVK